MSTPPVLIRNGALLQASDAELLADDAPLPASGRVLLSLARWRSERDALRGHGERIGVALPNDADVLAVWPELQTLKLIALEFPKSADGRAYSQARLLRERCGYTGELRATGDVLRDQLQFMQRCGFDAFLLRADQDAAACLAAFHDFTSAYQRAADQLPNVWSQRRAGV